MIIKFLLIAGAVGFGVLILRQPGPGSRLAIRRIIGALFVLAGIVGVLFPDVVTATANAVGVGRGTDLVLYVLVMVFLYTSVALYQRIHELETQITQLTRHLALAESRAPSSLTTRAVNPQESGE